MASLVENGCGVWKQRREIDDPERIEDRRRCSAARLFGWHLTRRRLQRCENGENEILLLPPPAIELEDDGSSAGRPCLMREMVESLSLGQ
jgi:hypothetical protein